MDLPKYTGTIHPEEWLKQSQTYCYLKDITDEQKILRICKFKIGSSINVPDDIDTLDKLIKVLKSHPTFEIFKNTCMLKLKSLKFLDSSDTSSFISNFRSLCDDAEINNPEEIKNLLFNTYSSNEFFQNEFVKRVNGINLVDEIVKIFSDIVFEESNIIKKDSLIALKHVATGKYLSSCNMCYQTGHQIVFAGEKLPTTSALWLLYLSKSSNQKLPNQINDVFYDDTIYFQHKITGGILRLSYDNKSPTTGHTEVTCRNNYGYYRLHLENTNTTNNITPYIKTKDIITIKFPENNYILRSHDATFAIGDKNFQEVIGHKERIGGNDEWQIEIALT